ncbi:MAG: lactonase family protein [Deltaproteobacteria bacterium]|nr:lactonase family protein [Deltaproteobacteria bacterium]
MFAILLLAACGSSAPAQHDAPGEAATHDASDARWVAYVGGYGGSIGWYSIDRATGALTMLGSVPQAGASFLAWDDPPAHLYAVDESNDKVVAYAIDAATGALTKLNEQSSGGSGPAHVTVSQGHVLVANYGDGAVAVLPIAADGSVQAATQTLAAGAHAHEVVVQGGFAFVPCLGAQYVAQYTWDGTALTANGHMMTAANAGPRHLAFSAIAGYLVDETASTLMVLQPSGGQLSPLQTITTLPAGFTGQNTGAEVVVSGSFVWTSNRGADDLAVFNAAADGRVTTVGHTPVGRTPRHFSITPDAMHLLVAAQAGNTVMAYAIDHASGMPSPVGQATTVDQPSFVGIAELP